MQWPVLKKLCIVFEIGIANFLSHINMPMVEAVSILYLEWLLLRFDVLSSLLSYLTVAYSSDSSDEEGVLARYDSDSDSDYHAGSDGSRGGYHPERLIANGHPSLPLSLDSDFDVERKFFAAMFPLIEILTYHQYSHPDQHYFNMIPTHFSSFIDYSLAFT